MESGEVAETWLDTQLIANDRWDDGLPDDVAPWVATAFAELAEMSIDDVTAAAEASVMPAGVAPPIQPSADTDTDADTDADADAAGGLALDDWLGSHAGFEAFDDSAGFAVVETDLDDDVDGSVHMAVDADPATSLAAMASAPLAVPPGLTDPFDQPVRRMSDTDADPDAVARAAIDLDDDIVTTPTFDHPGAEPAASDPGAGADWVEAPQPVMDGDRDDLAEQNDALTDGSLVVDPFDDVAVESSAGHEFAEAVSDEAPHPGQTDLDDDGWGDV